MLIQQLNKDEIGVIFGFLDCYFLQETFRLVSRSFNLMLIQEEFQETYVMTKIRSMTSEDTPRSFNRYRMDTLYGPYFSLEKDFRKSFFELKEKIDKEIEESLKHRHQVAKTKSSKEDCYQHFEEIKSTIKRKHLEPLIGMDWNKDCCTGGQRSNHKKIIFNGEGAVGKTSLIHYLNYGRFPEYFNIPFDTPRISYRFNNEEISNFFLWDTAGQEDYDRLRPLSYPDTDVFCLCFNIACTTSFENIQYRWIPEIQHFNPMTPIILMGCKIDLRKNNKSLKDLKFKHFTKPISFSEGELMARNTGCCTYIESSAITGEGNITDFVEIFAKTIIYYNYQRDLFPKKKKCHLM